MPKAAERSELDRTHQPPCLPDDYPHGADKETWSAYWVSKAPPFTEAKKEALRSLLKPAPPHRGD